MAPTRIRWYFNEAAAYNCGKRHQQVAQALAVARTSMRPQHITAENGTTTGGLDSTFHTSMRPQHITAENIDGRQTQRPAAVATSMRPQHITAENMNLFAYLPLIRCTSMRPQHITAENRVRGVARGGGLTTSMRPQHITAENRHRPPKRYAQPANDFNEAAAYNCGKLVGIGGFGWNPVSLQ